MCETHEKDKLQGVHTYCVNILGSRINLALDVEEFRLVEIVKRKIVKADDAHGVQKANRFSELYTILTKRRIVGKRWSVLYLLHSLSMTKVRIRFH
jgi:hypothetical protein